LFGIAPHASQLICLFSYSSTLTFTVNEFRKCLRDAGNIFISTGYEHLA